MTPAEMMKSGMSIWADGETSLELEEIFEQHINSREYSQMADEELDEIDPELYGIPWRELGWDVRKWGFSDPQH